MNARLKKILKIAGLIALAPLATIMLPVWFGIPLLTLPLWIVAMPIILPAIGLFAYFCYKDAQHMKVWHAQLEEYLGYKAARERGETDVSLIGEDKWYDDLRHCYNAEEYHNEFMEKLETASPLTPADEDQESSEDSMSLNSHRQPINSSANTRRHAASEGDGNLNINGVTIQQ